MLWLYDMSYITVNDGYGIREHRGQYGLSESKRRWEPQKSCEMPVSRIVRDVAAQKGEAETTPGTSLAQLRGVQPVARELKFCGPRKDTVF